MRFSATRRRVLVGGTALLGAGAFGGQRAFAADTALRLIFWGGQARADRTYAVADLYRKSHPDISIAGEFLAWPDYWPKVATQTAGGNLPDIVQMDYRYIGEYARRGVLAPLDAYAGSGLDTAAIDKDQIANGAIDGKLYGISLGVATGAMITNAEAIARAGLDFDPMGVTYDDLKAMAADFTKANPGMVLSADGSGVELLFENWLRQRGKALYTPEGQIAFDAGDVTDWFALWNGLRDAGACLSAEEQALETGPQESTGLVRRKAATTFATSNQLVAFQALMTERLGIAIYPMIAPDTPGGHYRNSSQFFSIAATSPAKDAAIAFVNFFATDPAAGMLLGVERGVPVSETVRQAIAPDLDEPSRLAVKYVADLGAIAGNVPPSPPAAAGEVEVALKTKSQEVAFGQQSPEEAGPDFVHIVQDILSRAT